MSVTTDTFQQLIPLIGARDSDAVLDWMNEHAVDGLDRCTLGALLAYSAGYGLRADMGPIPAGGFFGLVKLSGGEQVAPDLYQQMISAAMNGDAQMLGDLVVAAEGTQYGDSEELDLLDVAVLDLINFLGEALAANPDWLNR